MNQKPSILVLALAALAFVAGSAEAASRITLTPAMFSLGAGSSGNPGLFADEPSLAGDPLAGTTGDPVNTWISTNGVHLNIAYLDLGAQYQLTHLAFYDRNGTADFRVYDDATGALLVQDGLLDYKVWEVRPLAVTTNRLRFENSTGFGRVPEIVLYGASAVGDGGPVPGEFKVTTHTTAAHNSYACDASACDNIVEPLTGGVYQVSSIAGNLVVGAGARVCLRGGGAPFRGQLRLVDLRGTEADPIEITNCGGQVVFDTIREPIGASRSVHFKVLGNGHASALYGIKLVGPQGDAIKVRTFSRNFEVAWIESTNAEGTLLKTKSEAKGADVVTGQTFVQTGTHIHHLRSNSTVQHEAFYIGSTGCTAGAPVAEFPDAPLEDVRVHDNILLDSGADGLQVGCASGGDVEIYRNYVNGAGHRPFNGDLRQRHGIQVGPSSPARVFDNWVEDTASDCVHAAAGHPDGMFIYNNVLKGCPQAAYLNNNLEFAAQVVVANNTILTTSGHGFRSSGNHRTRPTPAFHIDNNLFVGTTEDTVMVYDDQAGGAPLTSLQTVAPRAQLYFADTSGPRFMDGPNGDYRLRGDSPARDAGVDTSSFGVTTDLRGVDRDAEYDVGAFEYVP